MAWLNKLVQNVIGTGLSIGGGIAKTAWGGGLASRMALGAGIGGVTGYLTSDSDRFAGKVQSAVVGATVGATAGAVFHGATKALPHLSPFTMRPNGRWGATWSDTVGSGANKIRIGMRTEEKRSIGVKDFFKSGWGSPIGMRSMKSPTASWASEVGMGGGESIKIGMQTNMKTSLHPYIKDIGGWYKWGMAGGAAGVIMAGRSERGAMRPSDLTYANSPTLSGARVNARYDQQAIAIDQMAGGIAPTGDVMTAPQMFGSTTPNQARNAFQNSTYGLTQGLHRNRH